VPVPDGVVRRIAAGVLATFVVMAIRTAHAGSITVTDDRGNTVTLPAPARRIVSLAPSATALLFDVGAAKQTVATVSGTRYPVAAGKLPKVGDSSGLDLERIVSLRPDLVVAWFSGNGPARIAQLRRLGLTVYVTEPTRLSDVASNLEKLALLSGHERAGRNVAARFRREVARLAGRYENRRPLRVFYEIWGQPLMTVGGSQWISQVVRLCGGRNIFRGMDSKAPTVDREAVLAARPQIIVADAPDDVTARRWLTAWHAWPSLPAVRLKGLIQAPANILSEPTPRLLAGARWLCRRMQQVRGRITAARIGDAH